MATAVAEKGPLGLDNPMGTDGFEFVEYAAPDAELLRDAVHQDGLPRGRPPQAQDRHLAPPGRLQFHHQCRAQQLRRGIRRGPRPVRLRDGLPLQGRQSGACPRARAWRDRCDSDVAEGELDIPAIEGIGGSRLYFVDRYGDERLDLRRRFRLPPRLARARGEPCLAPDLHRPPHPQRESRPDGALGRFLREALQLPRDPLLRHRGQGHRPVLQGDDLARAARSASRFNESQDDKSQIEEFLREYKGEGIQHIALGSDDIYAAVDIIARPRHSVPGHARDILRAARQRIQGHGEIDPRAQEARAS